MIGVWDSYMFNMRELGMSRDDIGPPLILNEVPIWLMCRPDFGNEAVKTRLVDVVNKLRDQGVFKSIIAKYIGNVELTALIMGLCRLPRPWQSSMNMTDTIDHGPGVVPLGVLNWSSILQ